MSVDIAPCSSPALHCAGIWRQFPPLPPQSGGSFGAHFPLGWTWKPALHTQRPSKHAPQRDDTAGSSLHSASVLQTTFDGGPASGLDGSGVDPSSGGVVGTPDDDDEDDEDDEEGPASLGDDTGATSAPQAATTSAATTSLTVSIPGR